MSRATAPPSSGCSRSPHGILLVTGPTGSGKTTTLYAALGSINDRSRNIMTVEDPIEYSVDGVGQTQVNPRTELTFARGLRAILRQDPDVIMVGEIRDRETAQIAVEAAMTGHLVLSTLHTNTAVGAVARLTDMGVEPFLLAPIAGRRGGAAAGPRALPRLRPARHARPRPTATSSTARSPSARRCAASHGCPACLGLGYRGRTGIYEVVTIDREMEALIHRGAAEAELVAHARRLGPSLIEDGVRKIGQGITTVEEVARVAQER